jgi:hypothetical protein
VPSVFALARSHLCGASNPGSSQNPLSADPYIIQRRPRPILTLPLINQGKLISILHLENNLTPRVFTRDRLTVLKVLASPARYPLRPRDFIAILRIVKGNSGARKEDVLMLVEYFVGQYARRAGKVIRSIDKKTLELFQSYDWPGKIWELQNVVGDSNIWPCSLSR